MKSIIEATCEITATLSIPDGYGHHDERRIVRACSDCAEFILTRQFVPTWNWDEMDVSTTYGSFGRCWQCPSTAQRRRAARAE